MKHIVAYLDRDLVLSAAAASPFLTYFHKYIFSDSQFIVTFVLALALDFVLGTYRAIKEKRFSLRKFGDGIVRGVVLFGVLFIIHSAAFHETRPAIVDAAKYIDGAAYWLFLGYELLSILGHARALGIKMPSKIESLIESKIESVDKSNELTEIANPNKNKND